jgi:hypothetical protein
MIPASIFGPQSEAKALIDSWGCITFKMNRSVQPIMVTLAGHSLHLKGMVR